jgi:LysM repeat protein
VVPQVLSIARIAELSGVDVVDVRLANNDLDPNLSTTPGRNYPLYLPVGKGDQLSTALAALPTDQPQVMLASRTVPEIPIEQPERRSTERRTHVVKPGETLSSIARTYDVEVSALAKANDIGNPFTLSIGQRLVLPGDKSATRVVYTVKAGNSLDEVAEIFSVRDEDILSWNDLRSRKIKSGQKLTLFPPRDYETHTYKVRRGDSLAAIARRFGVSIEHLLTVNGLTSKKILRPGQRLVLYVPA